MRPGLRASFHKPHAEHWSWWQPARSLSSAPSETQGTVPLLQSLAHIPTGTDTAVTETLYHINNAQ